MAEIDIVRGDTRVITATFLESAGDPINLSGGEVFFTVNADSEPTDDTEAVIQKDISSFSTPTTGVLSFTLSASDTNITPATYWYDVQFVSGAGVVTSLPKDKFIIRSDITRRTA